MAERKSEERIKKAFSQVKKDLRVLTDNTDKNLHLIERQSKQIDKLIDEMIILKERVARLEKERNNLDLKKKTEEKV